jgi:hypothetical protein
MKNQIRFYEGSSMYNLVETELNITEDFVLMKLAKQYEYRPTTETLWADVIINNEITRYLLDYQNKSLIVKSFSNI